MPTIKQVPLELLIANRKRGAALTHLTASESFAVHPTVEYSRSVGFHIYGDLSLKLRLCAAEDGDNAQRYLDILQTYASIADICAQQEDAHLLEVHGERIHLLLPAEVLTVEAIRRLLSFSVSFTQTIYKTIKPKAGDDFNSFAMATDYGPALLLPSDVGGGSLVSLGNAANTPAKRLSRTPAVSAGYCAVRREMLKTSFQNLGEKDWIEVNVLTPRDYVATIVDESRSQKMFSAACEILKSSRPTRLIELASASVFADPNRASVTDPIRIQGVAFRADLDGFTKEVEAAFSQGGDAVIRLVERFRKIMSYSRQYALAQKRPFIEMPWAGDCATIILLPRDGEKLEEVRRYLLATAARDWHGQQEKSDIDATPWSRTLGKEPILKLLM